MLALRETKLKAHRSFSIGRKYLATNKLARKVCELGDFHRRIRPLNCRLSARTNTYTQTNEQDDDEDERQ